jgi:hypothetical protein
MRLKAEIWVKAYIRRLAGDGVMAMVAKRGDEAAGAIFIKVALLDGSAALYGPAPAGLDGAEADRRWVALADRAAGNEAKIEERLTRERKLDSDIWIIEVEDRLGRHGLDDWLYREAR